MRYFIVLLALCLSSCSDSPNPEIRFGLETAPITLDPRFATDAQSTRINRLLYQQLVDFDVQLKPAPALAHWETLGTRHYRFHLSSTQFHNSTPLTSADVKATYDYVLNPDHTSPHRKSLEIIREIRVLDDNTLDFLLNQSNPLFPGLLLRGILPAALVANTHSFNQHPIGSGPFEIIGKLSTNSVTLRRREDGQVIRFMEVKDPVVRVLKLLRGELDMLQGDVSPELINWLSQRDDVVVRHTPGSNFTYLGFNLQDPLTGQLAIRRAIAHAIDREAIIRHLLVTARPAESLLPPEHWAGNTTLQAHEHNPAKARSLLQAAGFGPDSPLQLTYKTSSNPARIRLASVIQAQLAESGIEVEIRSYDWGTLYGDIKAGRFQMYSLSWVGLKTPDIFRDIFHSEFIPPNGANRGRFNDPTTDQLIGEALGAQTLEAQAVFYRRLQARLHAQLPYVPLWYEGSAVVMRPEIQGYQTFADGRYDGLTTIHKSISPK